MHEALNHVHSCLSPSKEGVSYSLSESTWIGDHASCAVMFGNNKNSK